MVLAALVAPVDLADLAASALLAVVFTATESDLPQRAVAGTAMAQRAAALVAGMVTA